MRGRRAPRTRCRARPPDPRSRRRAGRTWWPARSPSRSPSSGSDQLVDVRVARLAVVVVPAALLGRDADVDRVLAQVLLGLLGLVQVHAVDLRPAARTARDPALADQH